MSTTNDIELKEKLIPEYDNPFTLDPVRLATLCHTDNHHHVDEKSDMIKSSRMI